MVIPLNFPLCVIWFSFKYAVPCFYGIHGKVLQTLS